MLFGRGVVGRDIFLIFVLLLPPFSILRDHWGFCQKKIVFRLPSIIDTIYGNACTVFSYRWRVVYLFLEGFRVQDIATILRVGCTFLKNVIKLYRETSTVNYPAERVVA